MAREVFFPNPDNKPSGFSPVVRAGNTVFVSGQVSVDDRGEPVGVGDTRAQAEQCFRNVELALVKAGAVWSDVTKITCFLVEGADYAAYAAVRLAIFPEDGPASSTVFVSALVRPEYLVEIEAIAVKPGTMKVHGL